MVNFSCFQTVTRLTLILTTTTRPPTLRDWQRDTNKHWCSQLSQLQIFYFDNFADRADSWCGFHQWLPVSPLGGKNENKQWITESYSPGTGPELNNINVRIMFPLIRQRGSWTNISVERDKMLCNELLASHRLQPPAVSPSDVCHDVDVVCKASAPYYYRSSYSHPTQNNQLKIYPQCKTRNVINE